MTNEKINEMWTKLNETNLTGKRAATILKKFMTKEENKAYTKESLEYMKAHPECLESPRKFDKAMNAILLKYVESRKFADAKKLMAKIATFVERMVADNEIEMPEIVFDATSCKANKKQIKLAAIELLYKVNKDEEAIYKSICNWFVEVFGKFYGKEITADVDAIWNEEEEAKNNEENDEVENNADNADNQITIHDESLDGEVRTMAIRKIFTKEKAVRTKNKISLNATWDGTPVIFEAGKTWKRKKNHYGRVKIRNEWYYPDRQCGRIALIHDDYVYPESCTMAQLTFNLVLEIIEKITGIRYIL